MVGVVALSKAGLVLGDRQPAGLRSHYAKKEEIGTISKWESKGI